MIQYLERHQIDDIKYNNCIKSAHNSRIYAYSWYLDCVADHWDALILNDYEVVMPLPWRCKYFIKYIYPPAWTQQLGIFSEMNISKELTLDFVRSIPKKFKKITIQFNSGNEATFLNTEKRVNYMLYLNTPYKQIYSGFNKNRKRDIKKSLALNISVENDVKAQKFLNFYLNQSKSYQLNQNQIDTLKLLLHSNNKAVHICGIRKNEKLIAALAWLKDENRITYLLPIATGDAKNVGLPTFIISELIKQYSNTNLVVDFEGSMISGVANFYESFGAVEEKYYLYEKPFRLF